MAIRKIAQLGHPVLRAGTRQVSASELSSSSVQMLIDDMIATMRDADGAGIAAAQVYEPLSICVIEVKANPRYPAFPEIPLMVLVNPIVEPELVDPLGTLSDTDAIMIYEGCLSVPGLRGRVRRPRRVRVAAMDRHGDALAFEWEGVRAAVVQHEVDHLNGVLFVDRADPKTLSFSKELERHVPESARIVDGGEHAR